MHVTFPKFKMGEEVVREIAEPPSYGKTECLLLLLLLLLSVINCSPEHNKVLRLQYTYQDYTGTDNIEHIIMLVFQSSGVYIVMGSHQNTLSTSDIFLQLLFINVLVKGFFLL